MSPCDVCGAKFIGKAATKKHKKATGHCVCIHCDKILGSSAELSSHIRDTHAYNCPQCAQLFTSERLLKNHQKGLRHCYCGDCNKTFSDSAALAAHLQSSRHSTEFRCCDCDREFKSCVALEQHLRDKIHSKPAKKSESAVLRVSHQCPRCPRKFASPTALKAHLKSLIHCPLGNISCFSTACKKRFPSPSAVIQHLESASCPSGADRDDLRRLVVEHDTDRLVTDGAATISSTLAEVSERLQTKPRRRSLTSEPQADLLVPTLSSTTSQGCWTPKSGSASEWVTLLVSESKENRCSFCGPKRRPFRSRAALQDHLNSPAHEEPFSFCPAALPGLGSGQSVEIKYFKTVSALLQHVESGACIGGKAGFVKVANYLEERLRQLGLNMRLTIK